MSPIGCLLGDSVIPLFNPSGREAWQEGEATYSSVMRCGEGFALV